MTLVQAIRLLEALGGCIYRRGFDDGNFYEVAPDNTLRCLKNGAVLTLDDIRARDWDHIPF